MDVHKELQRLLHVPHLVLVDRGNSAIKVALRVIQHRSGKILYPDQGGWMTYAQFIEETSFHPTTVKTQDGLIDLEDLEKKCLVADAFIYANPAGYFCSQDITKIYEICRRHGCLVILDAAGGIGVTEQSDGAYTDVIIASFGRWKPVYAGYGGCVGSTDKEIFKRIQTHAHEFPYDIEQMKTLERELEGLHIRRSFLGAKRAKILRDLSGQDVIHSERDGLNVVIGYSTEKEKAQLIDYCQKEGYEYTDCPRYIRVLRPAISIEVKRLREPSR